MSDEPGSSAPFPHPVLIRIGDDWMCVEDARQSRECLLTRFEDQSGPSWKRALAAGDAAVGDNGSGEHARVTLIVAAMEAGYRFEVLDDDMLAFERRIELEAENGLLSILDEPDFGKV